MVIRRLSCVFGVVGEGLVAVAFVVGVLLGAGVEEFGCVVLGSGPGCELPGPLQAGSDGVWMWEVHSLLAEEEAALGISPDAGAAEAPGELFRYVDLR